MGTNKDYFSELDPAYQGQGLKFGIVMSRFNRDICEGLLSACEAELLRLGVAREDVLLVNVPGALEHPLALQELALSEKYDALIAPWCVATPTISKWSRTNPHAASSMCS